MGKMSKTMMWSIAGTVVVLGVIVYVVMQQNKGKEYTTTNMPGQEQASAGITPRLGETGNTAYNDALDKYGTNRIQFNDACQTIPNNVTYKAGTQVMFDNRSAGAHTITFNGTKHTIAGFGFTVISMSALTYPSTILIDCDKSQNVATVLIQR